MLDADVIVIGGGPAGTVAAALLVNKGWRVLVLERAQFPRFSIGESLLPQCMSILEEADMLAVIQEAGFQYKGGALFERGQASANFDFHQKLTPGWGDTFQVERDRFDWLLACEAEKKGVCIRYQETITSVSSQLKTPQVTTKNAAGECRNYRCRFILDASGFGRVLPKLLDLEQPSSFPVRSSLFSHIADGMVPETFDRNNILITVHPRDHDVWYWLIPFSNGRSSIGVVATPEYLAARQLSNNDLLKTLVNEAPGLSSRLKACTWDQEVRQITGFATEVTNIYGMNYALLGNACGFLDPVFSSGVTIALKSASLAAPLVDRQLQGLDVDWEHEFSVPLQKGIDVFRCYVEAWYDHSFQDVIFFAHQRKDVKDCICSILAGYAWDESNPYVKFAKRKLTVLAQFCNNMPALSQAGDQ